MPEMGVGVARLLYSIRLSPLFTAGVFYCSRFRIDGPIDTKTAIRAFTSLYNFSSARAGYVVNYNVLIKELLYCWY
jgi:hypothetical protein